MRNIVAVCSPIDLKKQERARKKNLEVILPILESEGITRLVMESRFQSANMKDMAHFKTMKRKGIVHSIELGFGDPSVEHCLWVPDQILGAWGDMALRKDNLIWKHEWESLQDRVDVVRSVF